MSEKKETQSETAVEAQDSRVKLSLSEAEAMLPDGDDIHTFRGGGGMLLGADWRRKKILSAIKKYGAELSGQQATAMKHGLVLIDDRGPLFIATRDASESATASSKPKEAA